MSEGPVYDKREQLEQVQSGLLEGETIHCVYDAVGTGTGFLAVTDKRVILQDKSFGGKRIALTSIPHNKIHAVSVLSNKSWSGPFFSSSSIAVSVSGHDYEVDFRGSDKAHHAHNLILWYMMRG